MHYDGRVLRGRGAGTRAKGKNSTISGEAQVTGTRLCVFLIIGMAVAASSCSSVSLKRLPSFYDGGLDYKVDPYIRAAVSLQALGKDKGCERLLALARSSSDVLQGQQVFILCRMLFAAKPGADFRGPAIGAPTFLRGRSDWSLEPIECVDGVPFLITRGYDIDGCPEQSWSYVDYCMKECVWSNYHWRLLTYAEKKAALAKLLASNKWKEPVDERDIEFLSAQIEDVK